MRGVAFDCSNRKEGLGGVELWSGAIHESPRDKMNKPTTAL